VGRGEDRHVKPGKGGAFAQVELKNLLDGRKLNERFRSSDTVERVTLEQKSSSTSTNRAKCWSSWTSRITSRSSCTRISSATSAPVPAGRHGGDAGFYEDRPIGIELPETVVLEIVEADAVVRARPRPRPTSRPRPPRHAHPDPAYMARASGSGVDGDRRVHAPRGLDRVTTPRPSSR